MSETETEVVDVEYEAKALGWVSKEDFRGAEDEWVDAETFVRRGKEINPILRKNNERLMRELRARDTELQAIKQSVEEFKAYHAETAAREYDRALATLKQQKKEALANSDTDAVMELDEQIDELKSNKPSVRTEPAARAPDPAFVAWAKDNDWVFKDAELFKFAGAYSDVVALEHPEFTAKELLEEVSKRVKGKFPEKFGRPARRAAGMVEGSSGSDLTGGSSRGKSYADLPADAKAACDKFVKQGLLTKAQYVTDYFGGEG